MILIYGIVIILSSLAVNASEHEYSSDSLQIETMSIDTSKNMGDTVDKSGFDHIERDVDHRRQVWLGIGMMAFLAVIISSAQSWNPR